MTTIVPDGENIRKAVKWVGCERKDNPQAKTSALVQEAEMKFDLSPAEAEYLARLVRGEIGKSDCG